MYEIINKVPVTIFHVITVEPQYCQGSAWQARGRFAPAEGDTRLHKIKIQFIRYVHHRYVAARRQAKPLMSIIQLRIVKAIGVRLDCFFHLLGVRDLFLCLGILFNSGGSKRTPSGDKADTSPCTE